MTVGGIKEHSAVLLKLINEMGRFYLVDKARKEQILPTIEMCAQYMQPYFHGRTKETVFLLCLDAKCKALCCKELGEGGINSAGISVRKIVETAIREGASTVVLDHNHPSGIAIPSPEDIQTTRRIAAALQSVEVALADHIVVADGDYVSLRLSGWYHPEDCMLLL